ncbi:MAG: tetratricopeptide repeat protein [candidate division Zixibacteria bacterium]|nr:tetratricopeptide repeat protein [candidate division Zixibacteria bacterium]
MVFLEINWVTVIFLILAILGIIATYHTYYKGKKREKEKEEKKFKENIIERVAKVEASLEMLTKLYPQLKALEKLENSEKLQLSPEDIKKTVSDVLKTTNITPEAIDLRIEETLKKRLSKIDENIATFTTNILNEADKRFKAPVGDPSDYLSLGNVEFSKATYSKALELYEKAIELKPDFAEAWSNKGAALIKLNRHAEALQAFEKAIELKPDDAEAWSNKGVALDNLNRHEKALKAHEKAIELKPDDANAWFNRACLYSFKGEKEKALSDLKKAIELDISNKQQAKTDEDFKKLVE